MSENNSLAIAYGIKKRSLVPAGRDTAATKETINIPNPSVSSNTVTEEEARSLARHILEARSSSATSSNEDSDGNDFLNESSDHALESDPLELLGSGEEEEAAPKEDDSPSIAQIISRVRMKGIEP